MLGIWLQLCRENHITDVLVNTHAHADMVKQYVQAHSRGVRLTVSHEKQLLGSAGTLRMNREWLGFDNEFWVFYGDVLTNAELKPILDFHQVRRPAATLGVYEVSNPKQCGIVCVDDQYTIRDFVEKPAEPRGNLAFSGIMIGTPALLDEIPERVPADLGFHVLPKLLGRLAAYRISEYLVDIGTPSAYQYAQGSWPGFGAAA